jgi:hypothetical protein
MITHMNTELAVTRNNKIMGIIELINDMHLLERTGRGWRLVHEVHNYSITATTTKMGSFFPRFCDLESAEITKSQI